MPSNTKYVSVDRLSEFLTQLKAKLAANTSSSFPVAYAASAARATGDEDGANIKSTYAKATDVNAIDGRVTGLEGSVIKTINFQGSGQASASPLTVTGNAVTIDLHDYALKSEISAALHFRGVVVSESRLPTAPDVLVGDVYIVETDTDGDTNSEFVCTAVSPSTTWEKLGPTKDFSGFVTKKAAANGKIATFDSTGDVVGTTVDASVLTGGELAQGNSSFITGGAVYTAIQATEGLVSAEETRAKAAEDALDGRLDTLEGDSSTAGSVDYKIAQAVSGLDYSKVTDASGAKIDTLQEASAADITGLFS